jgi:hypothetical protein
MVESSTKKFIVDEGGNKRGASISAEDTAQTLNDLKEWFKTNASKYYQETLSSPH